jgi:hypothetical protein
MIFSTFCAFSCKLHLLLISWVVFFTTFVDLSYDAVCVNLPSSTMPVMTRSQSKLKRSTGSTDGLLQRNLNTTGSTDGLPISYLPIITSTNGLQTSYLPTAFLDSSSTTVFPSSIDNSSLSITDPIALDFQSSYSEVSNLKILDCLSFQNSTLLLPCTSFHNFSPLPSANMANDCDDSSGLSQTTKDMMDIHHLFHQFTQQLSGHMNNLQDQLKENDDRIRQEQLSFQQEMHEELDALRSFVTAYYPNVPSSSMASQSSASTTSTGHIPSVAIDPPSANVSAPSINKTTSMSSQDAQTRMMLMLMESFSKLSLVLVDHKTQDTKSDWPKFAGDAKKFRSWYLSIMALISIPPWNELYDVGNNDIVSSTTNTSLNGKLYAKIISVLEGQALQDVISRSHLHANGVLLLQELVQTLYKPTNVPEVLAAKAGEFWSKTKRLANETAGTCYNRFCELLNELDQTDDKISTKSAMRHFIFT